MELETLQLLEPLHRLAEKRATSTPVWVLSGFICGNHGLQLDLSTPHGKLLAGVLGSLAEFERDLLRAD
jgi:hypothetical protein